MFPDMGHNMMLEPGWASVAERIHSWMGQPRALAPGRRSAVVHQKIGQIPYLTARYSRANAIHHRRGSNEHRVKLL